jgi:hypothetical protein
MSKSTTVTTWVLISTIGIGETSAEIVAYMHGKEQVGIYHLAHFPPISTTNVMWVSPSQSLFSVTPTQLSAQPLFTLVSQHAKVKARPAPVHRQQLRASLARPNTKG